MPTSSRKMNKADLAAHDATFEERSGRFWTIRINPNKAALIAQTLRPCHLVIQNHGPGLIRLSAQNGDLMDLASGALRATYVYGTVTVEVRGGKSAVAQLEFLPVCFKN